MNNCPDWFCIFDDTCVEECDECNENEDRGCYNCGLFYLCYPAECPDWHCKYDEE